MKKYTRKITKSGRSRSVVIPAEIVDEMNIREKQKMVVWRSGKTIKITDWEPKK